MFLVGLDDRDIAKERRRLKKDELERKGVLDEADDLIDAGYSITPKGAATVNPDSNAVDFRDLEQGIASGTRLKTAAEKYKELTGEDAKVGLGSDKLENLNRANEYLIENNLTRSDVELTPEQTVSQALLKKTVQKVKKDQANYDAEFNYDEQTRLKELNYNRNVADAVRKRQGLVEDRDFRLSTIQAENEFALAEQQNLLKRAQLDMELEQANLDREYLNTKDQREYDYRQQKDGMEQFDRIMMLILGGTDKLF